MRLLAALLVALLAAGCVQPDAAPIPGADDAPQDTAPIARTVDAAPSADGTAGTGALALVARMPDGTRLAGVNVTVRNESRLTDADGAVRFDRLAPGPAPVEARKEAHRTAQLAVDIVAGQTVDAEAVLAAAGTDQHAHERGLFAHRDLYTFEGRFDCSATYVIITGDCLLLVDNATAQAGVPAQPGSATDERNLIDFPLDLTWTSLVVEMAWTSDAPTGEGMTLALEPAEAPADGHAAKYARASGGSPLRIELASGVKHETATAEDMPNPQGGEVIRARAYVMGLAHRPAGTDFLGVGAAKDHAFTLHVSVFYGEPVPAGYTALGGDA